MSLHEYVCMDHPNRDVRLVHPDSPRPWLPGAPVVPGSLWCWRHGCWEAIPEDWRRDEKECREKVLRAYANGVGGDFVYYAQRYCELVGQKPDLNDRYTVALFIASLTNSVWEHWHRRTS